MSKFSIWVKASRLPAQLFIFPSLLLGQITALYDGYNINWWILLLVHLYGLFMHLFIVYANDYADFETDQANQTYTPFTGGSRVLVEGELSKKELRMGSLIMVGLNLVFGILLSTLAGNWLILTAVIVGMLLFQMYSFSPVKLSYRGFGELLQMLGVGIILPTVGYLSQGGTLAQLPWWLFLLLLPAQYAMAISTSLPDEPSDKESSKNTTVVNLGSRPSKYLVLALYLLSLISVLIYFAGALTQWIAVSVFTLLAVLIINQLLVLVRFETQPGSKGLFNFVLLSILTNTLFGIGVSIILINL